jgi:hypothetical protein
VCVCVCVCVEGHVSDEEFASSGATGTVVASPSKPVDSVCDF